MKGRIYRLSVVLSAILTVVMSGIVSATALGQTPKQPGAEKQSAPPFRLTSLEGEKFDLSALRGKVVVLNFWFTGCAPCVAEFGKLNGLVKKYENKGVVFIAPTLDDEKVLGAFFK